LHAGITPELAAMNTTAGSGDHVDTVGSKVAKGELGVDEPGRLVGIH